MPRQSIAGVKEFANASVSKVGIASMRQRIAQLEAEKARLLDRMDEDSDAALKVHLAAINKDLAAARERLIHYELQVGRQNLMTRL